MVCRSIREPDFFLKKNPWRSRPRNARGFFLLGEAPWRNPHLIRGQIKTFRVANNQAAAARNAAITGCPLWLAMNASNAAANAVRIPNTNTAFVCTTRVATLNRIQRFQIQLRLSPGAVRFGRWQKGWSLCSIWLIVQRGSGEVFQNWRISEKSCKRRTLSPFNKCQREGSACKPPRRAN